MKHIVFLYLTLCYSVGLFTVMLLFLAYLRNKQGLLKYLLFYHLTGTSQIIFLAFLNYQVNVGGWWFNKIYNIAFYILQSLSILVLPRLCGKLIRIPLQKTFNRISAGLYLAFMGMVLYLWSNEIPPSWEGIDSLIGVRLFHLVVLSSVFFAIGIFLIYRHQMVKPTRKAFIIIIPVNLGVAALLDLFPLIRTFPESMIAAATWYLFWTSYFMRYIVMEYFLDSKAKADESPQGLLEGLELSEREKEILGLLLEGRLNKEIAGQLFISEATVKKHTQNIYRKLGVKNKVQLFNFIGSQNKSRAQ